MTETTEKKEIIIISPHADDEIIGTYTVLKNSKIRPIIIYTEEMDEFRKEETLKLREHFDIKVQLYTRQVPQHFMTKENLFYFPDPIFETHPHHRLQGAIGETFTRSGLNVIFYSINMQAPYIHETPNPDEKEKILNAVYPSQKSLWEFDKKYILFQGYNKWFMS